MTAELLDEPAEGESSDRLPKSAVAQGSNIPLGWKPTAEKPVPVVRCVCLKSNGERCGRWSIRGATVCLRHGGRLPNIREHAAAVVEATRMRIIDDADDAVDVLESLMQPGTSENVRLKAATEILDRSGVRGGYEIEQKTEITVSPSEQLNDRLNMLRRRGEEARDRMSDVFDARIIDGEVVSDEDSEATSSYDQPSLFDM